MSQGHLQTRNSLHAVKLHKKYVFAQNPPTTFDLFTQLFTEKSSPDIHRQLTMDCPYMGLFKVLKYAIRPFPCVHSKIVKSSF